MRKKSYFLGLFTGFFILFVIGVGVYGYSSIVTIDNENYYFDDGDLVSVEELERHIEYLEDEIEYIQEQKEYAVEGCFEACEQECEALAEQDTSGIELEINKLVTLKKGLDVRK